MTTELATVYDPKQVEEAVTEKWLAADAFHADGADVHAVVFAAARGELDAIDHQKMLAAHRLTIGEVVVLGERDGSTLDVTIDYVMRAYRDSRLGRWLYGPGARVFKPAGIDRITATASNDAHRSYLDRVGFVYDDTLQRYTRQL